MGLLSSLLVLAIAGCGLPSPSTPTNPFQDLEPIPLDGAPRDLTTDLAALGDLEAGRVIRIAARGADVDSVLVLTQDANSDEAGVMVGGGPANGPFDYRIPADGRYFVFVQFKLGRQPVEGEVTLSVGPGDAAFRPASRQVVRLIFEDGYLTNPGLFDPQDGTEADREFLESISGVVQAQVVTQVQAIFAGTPIEIIGESDPAPDGPFSRLRFVGDRVLAEEQEFAADAALPPPDPTRPQCQVRVVFGEVLPSGDASDLGNRILDDEAVVYVGSFQGRGQECWTAAINSLNNVVLLLAQTAAHEIGHLVGLQHVEQIDLMNRTATLAFQRELAFARGQLQVEVRSGGQTFTNVLTTVVQDPAVYFESNFGQ